MYLLGIESVKLGVKLRQFVNPVLNPCKDISLKTIYFIRHAKSSWSDAMLSDHDRPLNERGKYDAPRMARRLLGIGVSPDGILTSSAKRARQTAKAFRQVFGLGKEDILVREKLYHAWPETIEEEVKKLPVEWKTVLVFGHNPGYTDLANRLQHDNYIGNVPTCGIVGAHADVEQWSDFSLTDSKRIAYLYPKQVD